MIGPYLTIPALQERNELPLNLRLKNHPKNGKRNLIT
jgi:hypothetical protein